MEGAIHSSTIPIILLGSDLATWLLSFSLKQKFSIKFYSFFPKVVYSFRIIIRLHYVYTYFLIQPLCLDSTDLYSLTHVALPLLFIVSYFVVKSLKKPSWEPPSWSFGVAWTIVYCCMGYSSLLILRKCASWKKAALPLSIYALNLALNWAWTPIFFGAHEIGWAFYELTAVWITTIVMSIVFYRINPIAGSLILPYIAWSTLAVSLNYSVYRNN